MSSLAAVGIDLDGDEYADITKHDTFVAGVPHATFRRLRRDEPVSWWDEDDGSGFWAVVRYHDILAVSQGWRTYTSAKGIRLEEMSPEETEARRTLMELDPPEHTRLRRLVNRWFTPQAVAAYEDVIRDLTREILDEALQAQAFDFVTSVARRLPMRMLGRLMDVPDEDGERLVTLGDQMIANTDPEFTDHVVDLTDTEDYRLLPFRSPAGIELFDYAGELAAARRACPGEDLVTRMLSTPPDGDPLSDGEFKNFFALMVAAGNDTTRYTIAQGLHTLMHHPDQLAALRSEPDLIGSAVEEILRWGTVTMHFRRTANADTELHGVPIRAGDKVVMWYVSGNYDEDQFPDPYRFDLRRQPNAHLAFGLKGPHYCLGAWLARLEVRVTFEELLARVRTIEPAGPIERLRSNFISGIKHLPVRVTPA